MRARRLVLGLVGLSCALPALLPLAGSVPPRRAEAAASAAAAGAVPVGGAVPLALLPADGGEVSEAVAASFVRPMLKLPEGAPIEFAWARVDVDGDGYDELALSLRGADRCGADGCPFVLMRRKADKAWKAVMATPALSVSTRPDPPRRSRVLVTMSSQGPREWRWDEGGGQMVPADGSAPPASPAADAGR